jgi:hypothetical protein
MYAIDNSLESWLYLLNLLIHTYLREIHFHDSSLNTIISENLAPCESKLLYSNQFLDSYSDFLNRAKTLSQKLLGQGYVQPLLLSFLQKFYDIIERYEVSVSQMRIYIFKFYVSPDLTLPDFTPPWIDSLTMWRMLYTEQDMLTHPKHLMSLQVAMRVHIATALIFCVCDVLVFCWCPMSLFFCLMSFVHIVFAISLDCDSCNYPIACSFGILLPLFVRWHTILWK